MDNNTYNNQHTLSYTPTNLDSPNRSPPQPSPQMSSSSPNCLFFCKDNVLSPKGIVLLFFAVFLGMFVVHFVPQHIPHIVLGLFVLSTLCILIVDYMRRNQLADVTQARPTTFAQSLVLTNYTLIALFYVGSLLGGYMYRRVAGLAVCVVGVILMGFPNRALEWGGRSVNRERFYGGGLMELEQQCLHKKDYTCIGKNTFCNGNRIRPCPNGTICKTCDSPPCTTSPCVYPHHIGDFALLHKTETPAPQPS